MVQRKLIQLVSMRMWVQSLASLSGLGIQRCRELWCRLQMRLRSCAAAAPMRLLAWEPPCAMGAAQENGKKTKKKKITEHENTRGQMQNTENDWKLRDQEPTTILYI